MPAGGAANVGGRRGGGGRVKNRIDHFCVDQYRILGDEPPEVIILSKFQNSGNDTNPPLNKREKLQQKSL
jgi:hypothetical protein